MTDSIREQIFTAWGLRLTAITTANQYNSNMGSNALRSHLPAVSSPIVPCVGFHVDAEDAAPLYRDNLNKIVPIRVQGIAEFGSTQPPVMAELLYADIEECLLCQEYTLDYDSGGPNEISSGDPLEGEDSGATGLVFSVSLDSGTWAGGDAAGTFSMRRVSGDFENDEELSVGIDTGAATVDGVMSVQDEVELSTSGIAENIIMVGGSILPPDEKGKVVGVQIDFNVSYRQIAGNPYSQIN